MTTLCLRVAGDHTRQPTQGPRQRPAAEPPSRSPCALPPPPFPFDHPPQRLTARRAAEPLARAPLRGREVLFTPRTVAAKKSGIVAWWRWPSRRLRCIRARWIPTSPTASLGLWRPAGVRRSDTGTAGSAPGVSLDRWRSADTAGWPVSAASAEPPRGTRDYSTEPGDGWVERASRTL